MEAYPKNIKILIKEGMINKNNFLDEIQYLNWSADRMTPFSVPYNPNSSRIITQLFTAGGGVGFGDEDPPERGNKNFWPLMGICLARSVMRGMGPMSSVSVFELLEKLSKGIRGKELVIPFSRGEGKGETGVMNKNDISCDEIGGRVEGKQARQRFLMNGTTDRGYGNYKQLNKGKMEKVKDEKMPNEGEEGEIIVQTEYLSKKKRTRDDMKKETKTDMKGGVDEKELEEGELRVLESEESVEAMDQSGEKRRRVEDGEIGSVSELEELSVSNTGVPMSSELKQNLRASMLIEEDENQTMLGIFHTLSPIQYYPTPSLFKVKSTGDFLRRSLGKAKKFDPYYFTMTKEAKGGVEAREKTLGVDFVVAQSPPQTSGEDPILPAMSEILSKAYNRLLFIARCMEQGDEKAIWATIRDGVFATAHDLTRINDARVTLATGNKSLTSRGGGETGMIREKTRERIKEMGRKSPFFRGGGGYDNPPQYTYASLTSDLPAYDFLPASVDQEDFLAGSTLGATPPRVPNSRGAGQGSYNFRQNIENPRGRLFNRGTSATASQPRPPPRQMGRGGWGARGGYGTGRGAKRTSSTPTGNWRDGENNPAEQST
jgi:hypothetical protein